MFNLYDIEESSEIYGPGKRFVIWLQGCTLRCKGCWNMNMWSHANHWLMSEKELLQRIEATMGIEGITLIGGEPLQQSEKLLPFIRKIKERGLSVMLFTGYLWDELNLTQQECWQLSDIVICGRYEQEKRNILLQWRGSQNQEIIYNGERYKDFKMEDANYCEIEINENGEVIISGFPSEQILNELKELDG